MSLQERCEPAGPGEQPRARSAVPGGAARPWMELTGQTLRRKQQLHFPGTLSAWDQVTPEELRKVFRGDSSSSQYHSMTLPLFLAVSSLYVQLLLSKTRLKHKLCTMPWGEKIVSNTTV